MIISNQKRFIMFSPWKTASQTVAFRLQNYNDSRYDNFFYFNIYLNRVVHPHITCTDFSCLPESKLEYFKASFVRNPYDRAFSGFRQLQKDIKEQPYSNYPEPWIRDLVMKQLAENFSQLCQAQFKFDDWLELISDEQIYEIGRNSNFPLHPSHYWTHVAGKQFVDFIGKVENFEDDFRDFLNRVGIDNVPDGNLHVVDLEGGAKNNLFGYRYIDRMSQRSIEKINRLFEKDFELFNYKQISY
ncbi:MAG: Chondroitin 4-O-sulfotransferase [Ignavibacteria bacterium]|nr:Chondroitin 4-O-sulfotransferase [Ignavibacteria bacterium]